MVFTGTLKVFDKDSLHKKVEDEIILLYVVKLLKVTEYGLKAQFNKGLS